MSEEKMREEFEAKYVGAYLDKHEGLYADPAIRELWGCWQSACAHKESEFVKEREQLRALIAMQAEALKEIDTMVNNQGLSHALIARTLNSSAESVAAWEAEKLEPLRKEMAMLVEAVNESSAYIRMNDNGTGSAFDVLVKNKMALSSINTTIEQKKEGGL